MAVEVATRAFYEQEQGCAFPHAYLVGLLRADGVVQEIACASTHALRSLLDRSGVLAFRLLAAEGEDREEIAREISEARVLH
jgi:hypothetical protein